MIVCFIRPDVNMRLLNYLCSLSRHFTKLQPIPVKDEIVPHHTFDYLTLKQYIYYQKTKKRVLDWYTQTTYREAFTLPFYKSGK